MDSSTGPSPESPFLHHQHLLPHIQNYGMFCRLFFFCVPPPSLKTGRRRNTRVCCGYQPTSVLQKQPWLIYFGLFSKYIISIVQVSETTEKTTEKDE